MVDITNGQRGREARKGRRAGAKERPGSQECGDREVWRECSMLTEQRKEQEKKLKREICRDR